MCKISNNGTDYVSPRHCIMFLDIAEHPPQNRTSSRLLQNIPQNYFTASTLQMLLHVTAYPQYHCKAPSTYQGKLPGQTILGLEKLLILNDFLVITNQLQNICKHLIFAATMHQYSNRSGDFRDDSASKTMGK